MNKNIKKTMQGAMALGLLLPTAGNVTTAFASGNDVVAPDGKETTNENGTKYTTTKMPETNTIKLYKRQYRVKEDGNFIERGTGVIKDSLDNALGDLDGKDDQLITNTGEKLDNKDLLGTEAYNPDAYGEVEFTLFKLGTGKDVEDALKPEGLEYKSNMTKEQKRAWSIAISKNAKKIGEEIEEAYKAGKPLPYGATKVEEKSVGKDGSVSFENVKTTDKVVNEDGSKSTVDAKYIIVETKAPATVVGKSNPMFLSLPVVNEEGKYKEGEISLYPKNQNKEQTVKLKKYGENKETPLKGAKFKVYKGSPANKDNKPIKDLNGNDFIAESKEDGSFSIDGLTRGNYFLVEQEVEKLIDGMEVDAEKYKPRDFEYLAGYDAKHNEYNVLKFCVDSNGQARLGHLNKNGDKITLPGGKEVNTEDAQTLEEYVIDYVNYKKPDFEKKTLLKEDEIKKGFNYYEDIPFGVTLTVPKNLYQYSKFEFSDQLVDKDGKETKAVEYVRSSDGKDLVGLDVETDKGEKLKRGEDYFIEKDGMSTNKFRISFVDPDKKWTPKEVEENKEKGEYRFSNKVITANSIKVKYKAQFRSNAIPEQIYANKAELTYNNAPKEGLTKDRYDNGRQEFKTYGHKFVKYEVRHGDNPKTEYDKLVKLQGAEFIIKDKDGKYFNGYTHNDNAEGKQEPYFVEYKSDEEAYKALKNNKEAILISDENGAFEIKGLKKGTYTVVEMKAPEGYAPWFGTSKSFTVGDKSYTDVEEITRIGNRKIGTMPITGGTMITLVIAGGTATAVVLGRASRKRNEEAEADVE